MHGVDAAIGGDRLLRRGERLCEDVPAVEAAPARVLAAPSEEVFVQALEGEEVDELVERSGHGVRP